MGNNRIKRSVSVLISMLLVFAQIISVAGCKGKDEDGVKRVSKDSTWFNAKVTGLDGKYKNKKRLKLNNNLQTMRNVLEGDRIYHCHDGS